MLSRFMLSRLIFSHFLSRSGTHVFTHTGTLQKGINDLMSHVSKSMRSYNENFTLGFEHG